MSGFADLLAERTRSRAVIVDDRITDPGYGAAYAAAIPGATLPRCPGPANLTQLAAPEELPAELLTVCD